MKTKNKVIITGKILLELTNVLKILGASVEQK